MFYWKNRDNVIPSDSCSDVPDHPSTGASTVKVVEASVPTVTPSETLKNTDVSAATEKPALKPVEHVLGLKDNDNNVKHKGEITSSLSETASMSGSISTSDSASESLLNPTNSRPKRNCAKRKYKNYKHMCKSGSSSAENDTTPSKQAKPLPGSIPSLSRLRAQELISRHCIKLDVPSQGTTQTDTDLDRYSGDTECYSDNDAISSNKGSAKPMTLSPKTDKPKRKVKTKPIVSSGVQNTPTPKPKSVTMQTSNGKLEIRHKGIRIQKTIRKHGCLKCKFVGDSNREINNHYRNNHQPLPCKYCSKSFNNPSSYRRHKYKHTKTEDKSFTCYRCNKTFPFESQLTSHKDIHRRLATFRCYFPGCTKYFRREATLVAHLKIHNGPILQCDQCDYTCKDQRYLSQHYRTHTGEKKYFCQKCDEGFIFYQLFKNTRFLMKVMNIELSIFVEIKFKIFCRIYSSCDIKNDSAKLALCPHPMSPPPMSPPMSQQNWPYVPTLCPPYVPPMSPLCPLLCPPYVPLCPPYVPSYVPPMSPLCPPYVPTYDSAKLALCPHHSQSQGSICYLIYI